RVARRRRAGVGSADLPGRRRLRHPLSRLRSDPGDARAGTRSFRRSAAPAPASSPARAALPWAARLRLPQLSGPAAARGRRRAGPPPHLARGGLAGAAVAGVDRTFLRLLRRAGPGADLERLLRRQLRLRKSRRQRAARLATAARSSSGRKGLRMVTFGTVFRNASAAVVKAPPVKNRILRAVSGCTSLTRS